jgi:ribosomal protein L35
MLPRIDVRRFETVGNDKVKRSRRNHSHLILKRRSKPECHRLILEPALRIVDAAGAHRLDKMRALSVEMQFVNFLDGGLEGRLKGRFGGKRAWTGGRSHGQSGERGSIF